MSYERAWVIGVFGRELLKRQSSTCDGGVRDPLVGERIRFACAAGYKTITLRTHAVLVAARAIYRQVASSLWRNGSMTISASPNLPRRGS